MSRKTYSEGHCGSCNNYYKWHCYNGTTAAWIHPQNDGCTGWAEQDEDYHSRVWSWGEEKIDWYDSSDGFIPFGKIKHFCWQVRTYINRKIRNLKFKYQNRKVPTLKIINGVAKWT